LLRRRLRLRKADATWGWSRRRLGPSGGSCFLFPGQAWSSAPFSFCLVATTRLQL